MEQNQEEEVDTVGKLLGWIALAIFVFETLSDALKRFQQLKELETKTTTTTSTGDNRL